MHSNGIAPHVQAFFADYLCQQKRLSPQTIVSCRDTFRLLLMFLRDQTGVEPSALRIADAGTLEAGKSADLIVLDANPLEDITNTRRISAVILRGATVDRSQPAQ